MKPVSSIDRYVIKKIRERRQELGLSQSDLAAYLGVNAGFIGKIESDAYATHYNLKHINDLCRVLKCSPKDLMPEKPLK